LFSARAGMWGRLPEPATMARVVAFVLLRFSAEADLALTKTTSEMLLR
jgi:hypothetical protein